MLIFCHIDFNMLFLAILKRKTNCAFIGNFSEILSHDTNGLLRTLCSRNPKTFEIRPVRATFSCFADPKVILFHASMKSMTF